MAKAKKSAGKAKKTKAAKKPARRKSAPKKRAPAKKSAKKAPPKKKPAKRAVLRGPKGRSGGGGDVVISDIDFIDQTGSGKAATIMYSCAGGTNGGSNIQPGPNSSPLDADGNPAWANVQMIQPWPATNVIGNTAVSTPGTFIVRALITQTSPGNFAYRITEQLPPSS